MEILHKVLNNLQKNRPLLALQTLKSLKRLRVANISSP